MDHVIRLLAGYRDVSLVHATIAITNFMPILESKKSVAYPR